MLVVFDGGSMRFTILLLTLALAQAASGATGDLYRQFQDPPHTYTVRPFWFWNGKLEAKEISLAFSVSFPGKCLHCNNHGNNNGIRDF